MSRYTINNASSHRLTKTQIAHERWNDLVIVFFARKHGYASAEDVWLEMRAKGHSLSVSSYYSRLKELVERGEIEKKPIGYNKYLYKTKPS